MNLLFQTGRIIINKTLNIKISDEITKGILYIFLGYFIISLFTQYLLVFEKFDFIKPIILISSISSIIFFNKFRLFCVKIYKTIMTNNLVSIITISLFFLISFCPINDADSLAYHLFIPQQIIENNGLIYRYDNFHFGLFGLGESFIIIAQLFKAEIIIHWLQFVALIFILHCIIGLNNFNKNRLLSTILFSIPCLIFLVYSAKPQILIISLSVFLFKEIIEKRIINILHVLLIALLFSIKINYIISSVIFLILIIYNHKKYLNKIIYFIPIGILFSIVIYFPLFFFKINYGFDFDFNFFRPIPSFIVGSKDFFEFILNYRDSNSFIFPINIFFADTLGNYSTTLGLPTLFLFGTFLNKKHLILNWFYYLLVLIYILSITFFLQSTARFFIEPLFWFLLLNKESLIKTKFNFFQKMVINSSYLIQFLGLVYLSGISIYAFSSIENRKSILSLTAYGYNISEKVNSIIDKENGVLFDHRSKAFLNNKNIFGNEFIYYGWERGEIIKHVEVEKIDYIVVDDSNLNKYIKYSSYVSDGPFYYKEVSRNPFNYGNNEKFWVLKFDKKLSCL